MIIMIIAGEIRFRVILAVGLAARYVFRARRLVPARRHGGRTSVPPAWQPFATIVVVIDFIVAVGYTPSSRKTPVSRHFTERQRNH
jgi:hypothetical protein